VGYFDFSSGYGSTLFSPPDIANIPKPFTKVGDKAPFFFSR